MTALNSLRLRPLLTTTERKEPRARARPTAFFAAAVSTALFVLLTGCGAPKPAKLVDGAQEAVSRSGDVTIRANVMTTATLSDAMAKRYGIERAGHRVLLMVSVRKGPEGQDTALPATVTAKVSNLHGQQRAMTMRELRSEGYVDYIGTAEVAPPDTLRFELEVVREDGARSSMQFSRDFVPQ